MKRKYKTTIIFLGITCLVGFALFGAIVGSGNDGYAQKYEFDVSSSTLIRVIKKFKSNNPGSNPPTAIYDPDTLDKTTSHFNTEVYSRRENMSFAFFIETNNNSNRSSIYLVSVNQGMDFREWEIINRDLDNTNSLKVKKIFEENILNRLGLNYKKKGNGMFIFWN